MQPTFGMFGLHEGLIQQLKNNGVVTPTPVQEAAIPRLLAGADVIAQAQTGTGKTLAFLLPILHRIRPQGGETEALIVTPTRELAIQITAEAKKLAGVMGVTVLAAYGGQDVEGQIRKLQSAPQIVIGTPGRLADHLRRGTLRLDRVSMLVIDEADQMLDMGFLPEVEGIIRDLPKSRQTMLFSATMPDSIRHLAKQYMNSPENIRIAGKRVTLEGIKQVVIETTDRAKLQTLLSLIERDQPYLAVVFCRTKIRAKKLTDQLISAGLDADELHGDLTQAKRELVMKRFREAKLQILVATDVAARGLDVEGVTHVFNYDIPHDADSYIHRIGRTGRAGAQGMAVTLAAPRDRAFLAQIEKRIGSAIEVRSMEPYGGETIRRERKEPSARRSADAKEKAQSRGGKGRPSNSRAGSGRRGSGRGSAQQPSAGKNGRRGASSTQTGGRRGEPRGNRNRGRGR